MAVQFTTTKTFDLACPACESRGIVKVGMRDGYQRYRCKACRKKFHTKGTAQGKRFPPEQMGAAIRMFYSGMSYKQIGESMEKLHDIPEPSKKTMYKWVKECTEKALDRMTDHKAQVGDEWVVDEMVVKVGGQNYWNWNVMDKGTRYILASHLSKRRDAREARKVLSKAIVQCCERAEGSAD